MKALVYTGPNSVAFMDVDDPKPDLQTDEVLIRVESVGICGSDMHAYLGHDDRRPAPLVLGHEAAGIVVSKAEEGRRVTVNPLVTCMECAACKRGQENLCAKRQIISMPPREGAFAQYLKMPRQNLVTVPDHISFDKASLTEPIACGWHAVRLARNAVAHIPRAQIRVLVLGGGAIGTGAALSAKAQGLHDVTVIEPNAERQSFMNENSELTVIGPEMLKPDETFDLIVDGVGYKATRETASARATPGGVIAHIGLGEASGGIDVRRLTLQEITFIGTYTYTMADFKDTAEAIFDGRLGSLDWLDLRPLDAGATAFEDLKAGRVMAPKIILKPH
ncbi:MAG: alcohol dehydrogenase catalytic domain-containing protein [Hyphomicrobiales bacterium]